MCTYSLYLFDASGSKANASVATIDCPNDAQALSEASKMFNRVRAVDAVEVWREGRSIVRLGGRFRPRQH
jgi:hypothetical protein